MCLFDKLKILSEKNCACGNLLLYLGAGLGTVHDGVAAVEREWILKFRQTFLSKFITGVNHPPICLWDITQLSSAHFLIFDPVIQMLVNQF